MFPIIPINTSSPTTECGPILYIDEVRAYYYCCYSLNGLLRELRGDGDMKEDGYYYWVIGDKFVFYYYEWVVNEECEKVTLVLYNTPPLINLRIINLCVFIRSEISFETVNGSISWSPSVPVYIYYWNNGYYWLYINILCITAATN